MDAATLNLIVSGGGFFVIIGGLIKLERRLTRLETAQEFILKSYKGAENE